MGGEQKAEEAFFECCNISDIPLNHLNGEPPSHLPVLLRYLSCWSAEAQWVRTEVQNLSYITGAGCSGWKKQRVLLVRRGGHQWSRVQKAGDHGSRFMQKGKLLQLANYNQTAAPRVFSWGSLSRSSSAYSNTRISSHLCSLCSFRRLCGLFSTSLTGVSSMVGPMVNHHPWGLNQCYLRLRAQCL